jgi:uncharacterized protein
VARLSGSGVAAAGGPDRQRVLGTLRAHERELRERFGVRSLALFGSVARGAARRGSDVDLLVEFDRPVGYFHLFRTEDHIRRLLGVRKVELVPRPAVHPELQPRIYGEAVDVLR